MEKQLLDFHNPYDNIEYIPVTFVLDRNVKLNWEIGYILAIVVCTVVVLLSVALSYMYIANKKGE